MLTSYSIVDGLLTPSLAEIKARWDGRSRMISSGAEDSIVLNPAEQNSLNFSRRVAHE